MTSPPPGGQVHLHRTHGARQAIDGPPARGDNSDWEAKNTRADVDPARPIG